MNGGFQIAAVPDSDQIGKFRHITDLNSRWYTWISIPVVAWQAKTLSNGE
jgi:hypothetical protein